MIHETIDLKTHFPDLAETASLTSYVQDVSDEIDPADRRITVLVCPGGGYQYTTDREAEPIALAFMAKRVNAFVLRYSCEPSRYPTALSQAAASVAYIRRNCGVYHAHPDKIAVIGFSAGGHLAACIGTLWNDEILRPYLGNAFGHNRPDAMVLCYAVTLWGEKGHASSYKLLLGDAPAGAYERLSLEKRVSASTPPAFIWHTVDDYGVPVENALYMADSLQRNGVSFELHVYTRGGHGLALGNDMTLAKGHPEQDNPHAATWFNLCCDWLKATL